jgi:ribosome-binding protein aMBF1 (putative translation factor)
MAFQRKGDELLWLTHFELEEDTFGPKKRKERQAGRKGDASAREGWLFSQLQPSGTPKYASIIIEAGERAGWSKSSLYRTADSLGVVKAKAADGSPTWTLPDAFA